MKTLQTLRTKVLNLTTGQKVLLGCSWLLILAGLGGYLYNNLENKGFAYFIFGFMVVEALSLVALVRGSVRN